MVSPMRMGPLASVHVNKISTSPRINAADQPQSGKDFKVGRSMSLQMRRGESGKTSLNRKDARAFTREREQARVTTIGFMSIQSPLMESKVARPDWKQSAGSPEASRLPESRETWCALNREDISHIKGATLAGVDGTVWR